MAVPNAVVISALSRGGSNILWNILQSHPRLCSPIRETGELIFDEIAPFRFFPPSTAKRIAAGRLARLVARGHVRHAFEQWKLRTLGSPDNGSRADGVPYQRHEVEQSIPCFKGVDSDVELNPLLEAIYGNVAYVPLVRDGYAVCDGWMRRGMSAEQAGRKYAGLVRRMLTPGDSDNPIVLVKFEEMVADPFGTAERLFKALDLSPTILPKLRLKSKRLLGRRGEHEPRFGEEGRKYWLAPHEIAQALDTGVDRRQSARLAPDARAAFERGAREALELLGYLGEASG